VEKGRFGKVQGTREEVSKGTAPSERQLNRSEVVLARQLLGLSTKIILSQYAIPTSEVLGGLITEHWWENDT
jgi:hypothetical protein